MTFSPPVALTIAGFDPSGGAGVAADLKTFTAYGCWGAAAITSLTFQNTRGVFGAVHQTAATVREQVLPVVAEYRVTALKTGMLPTREVIEEVARLCHETDLPAPVVDPVVRATSGYDLIDDAALRALVGQLFPLARVITPNLPEAERITGLKLNTADDLPRAAYALRDLGARAVLVKGGHLRETREATDVLLDENGELTVLQGAWIDSQNTHGTGCTLASAIAGGLAQGLGLPEAARCAKEFVAAMLRRTPPAAHSGSQQQP
jgi:hydroxymethylpyrimidine kinase/phosphomethylpyrimidine kinase